MNTVSLNTPNFSSLHFTAEPEIDPLKNYGWERFPKLTKTVDQITSLIKNRYQYKITWTEDTKGDVFFNGQKVLNNDASVQEGEKELTQYPINSGDYSPQLIGSLNTITQTVLRKITNEPNTNKAVKQLKKRTQVFQAMLNETTAQEITKTLKNYGCYTKGLLDPGEYNRRPFYHFYINDSYSGTHWKTYTLSATGNTRLRKTTQAAATTSTPRPTNST